MPTACRFCSSKLAAAIVTPESPHTNASRPQAAAAWWTPDDSSPPALLPHGYSQLATQCQKPATIHPSESQAPGLVNLLVPGGFPSHRALRPSTPPLSLTAREPLLPPRRARIPDSPPKGGKIEPATLQWYQKLCSPKAHGS
jgi:hypothetical protein